MSTTHIYLVRHGETDWNLVHRIQGHTDWPLNDRGRQQARLLQPRIAAIQPAAIYSSDLCRCMETARLSIGDESDVPVPGSRTPIQTNSALRERYFGEWEGLTLDEVHELDPEGYQNWRKMAPGYCPPGGETRSDLYARMGAFVETVCREWSGQSVVLFSHGGSINAAIAYALRISPDHPINLSVENVSISRLIARDMGWKIDFLNDTSHLAANLFPPKKG